MYKKKFVVLFIGMMLILGLTLPACTCGEAAPPAEETAPGELSFAATEYTNAEYGFSIKYPDDWGVKETEEGFLFHADAGGVGVPLVIIAAADSATFEAALNAVWGDSDIEITSQSETTLADGTPATEAITKLKLDGHGGRAIILGAQKDGTWIIVTVATVTLGALGAPYDEALFSEIAHTLQFK